MATYTKEIEITNKKYNYSELTDVFAMFILVSLPLGLVIGGLSAPHGGHFDFYKLVENFGCTM